MSAKPLVKLAAPFPRVPVEAAAKSGFGQLIGQALAVAGASIAGEALYNFGRRAINAMRFSSNYRRMLDANPDLRRADAQQVMDRYRILARFGPTIAEDPIVAGHWIKQTLEYPVISPTVLKEVVDVEGKARQQEGYPGQAQPFGALSAHLSKGLLRMRAED